MPCDSLGLERTEAASPELHGSIWLRSAPAGMPVLPCWPSRGALRGLQAHTSVRSVCACGCVMDAHVERIHQYAAKEQAELRVRISIPGSWRGFNNLTPSERRVSYEAEAIDWVPSGRSSSMAGRLRQVGVQSAQVGAGRGGAGRSSVRRSGSWSALVYKRHFIRGS